MNEKKTLFLLQLALGLNIITAQIQQIHFPEDRNRQTPQSSYPDDRNRQVPQSNYPDDRNRPPVQNNYPDDRNRPPVQSSYPNDRNRPTAQGSASAPVYVPNKVDTSYDPNADSIITRGITKLLLDINRVIPATSPYLENANNLVFGPLTIAGALCMVLLASVGQTYYEIANALGFNSGLDIQNNPLGVHEPLSRLSLKLSRDTGLNIGEQVNYALAIFVQQDYPLRPAYLQASKELYGSDVVNLDFRGNPLMAQDVINTWVSNRTNAKIPNLLNDYPPPNTRAIIVSVLYFKASWEFPFYEGHTKWRPFFVNGRKNPSDRMAEMMSNGGEFPYYKDTTLGVEIMGFPYKGKHSTMYVILPSNSNIEKLKKLENSLTPYDIEHLINSTKYTEAVVLFPKMKLESTINLKPALQTLGINSLFNPYQSNLALLSPGIDQRFNAQQAPFVSPPLTTPPSFVRPPPVPHNVNDGLVFVRFGSHTNCTPVYDQFTNTTYCRENIANQQNRAKRAVQDIPSLEALDKVRRQISTNPELVNPGIYADQVIHKVYMDITESGTEAAAATGISLNRSGGRVTFRVDIPFLFFIYNEDTKLILFWGSVKSPTPSIATPST